MTKKVTKKKTKKKKTTKKHSVHHTTHSNLNVEKALIENFVALQKVMTNLSVKFEGLTSQISKLLDLFEISAKSLAEKDFKMEKGGKENKKIVDKIDNLLEQNKLIARGLTLVHDRFPGDEGVPRPEPMQPSGVPGSPVREEGVKREIAGGGYQKSISSKRKEPSLVSEEQNAEDKPEF